MSRRTPVHPFSTLLHLVADAAEHAATATPDAHVRRPRVQVDGHRALRTDITELPDTYRLEIDVPGVSLEAITLEAKDDTLTVRVHDTRTDRGDRPDATTADATSTTLWRERATGAAARIFRFAQGVNTEGVTAKLAAGVLTLTVPKLARPTATRIPVTLG